jgi:hypothetical protein
MLARTCVEDFLEILLLCGNGYGIGALKLLRPMFERVVTLCYIQENPNEAQLYLNFHKITRRKVLSALREDFGHEMVNEAEWADSEAAYRAVKDDYQVRCECGRARTNHTWHKRDVISMAKKVGMDPLRVPAYLLPIQHLHASPDSFILRTRSADGRLLFQAGPQRIPARTALRSAHCLSLKVLEAIHMQFKNEPLRSLLETCNADFTAIWEKNCPVEPTDDSE